MLSERLTFTIPNGSTTAITLNHTLGVTPQYISLESFGPATGLDTGTQRYARGCSDGTRHWCYGEELSDASTTGSADSVQRTDAVLVEVTDSSGTETGRLVFTSWSSTTIVLTPSDAFAADAYVTLIAKAGLSNVYVDNIILSPNDTSNVSSTNPGFQPDMLQVFHPRNAGTIGNVTGRGSMCEGYATATAQVCVAQRREIQLNNYTFGAVRNDAVAVACLSTASIGNVITRVSLDATGYTLGRTSGDAGVRPICVVCFKGGNPVVGTFAAPTSTGTQSVTTTGHVSKWLRLLARPTVTASESTPTEPSMFMGGTAVGAGAGQSASGFRLDFNNETLNPNATDPLSQQTENEVYRAFTRTGADTLSESQSAVIDSIDPDEVVLDWQAVSATATLVAYASMGDPPNANNGVYYRMMMESLA